MQTATAIAHPNIALIKYWGKEEGPEKLPATGSLSLTLDGFHTRCTLTLDERLTRDELILNDEPASEEERARVALFLGLFRSHGAASPFARVVSSNSFPTASGLASSASAFAALGLVARRCYAPAMDETSLSDLVRRGSGSAARSLLGGVVLYEKRGRTMCASQLIAPEACPWRIVVAAVTSERKHLSSGAAMRESREHSPFYEAWVRSNDALLPLAKAAVWARDLQTLGTLAEKSCFLMHATMLGHTPPLLYWRPETVALVQAVWRLRAAEGLLGFVTIDAGPHVKVLCAAADAQEWAVRLGALGVAERIHVAAPGDAARLVEEGACA